MMMLTMREVSLTGGQREVGAATPGVAAATGATTSGCGTGYSGVGSLYLLGHYICWVIIYLFLFVAIMTCQNYLSKKREREGISELYLAII